LILYSLWRSKFVKEAVRVAASLAVGGFGLATAFELETLAALLRETGEPCMDVLDVLRAVLTGLRAALPLGVIAYGLPLLINRLLSSPFKTLRWFGAGCLVAIAITAIWNLWPDPQYGCPVPKTPIADSLVGAFFMLSSTSYWILSRFGLNPNSITVQRP
jgi:hypothetical protein